MQSGKKDIPVFLGMAIAITAIVFYAPINNKATGKVNDTEIGVATVRGKSPAMPHTTIVAHKDGTTEVVKTDRKNLIYFEMNDQLLELVVDKRTYNRLSTGEQIDVKYKVENSDNGQSIRPLAIRG